MSNCFDGLHTKTVRNNNQEYRKRKIMPRMKPHKTHKVNIILVT